MAVCQSDVTTCRGCYVWRAWLYLVQSHAKCILATLGGTHGKSNSKPCNALLFHLQWLRWKQAPYTKGIVSVHWSFIITAKTRVGVLIVLVPSFIGSPAIDQEAEIWFKLPAAKPTAGTELPGTNAFNKDSTPKWGTPIPRIGDYLLTRSHSTW